jgi:nitrite reductase/ring-hydroxylating ferredoxin subunit
VFHLSANLVATALYTGSWWARRRGRPQVGITLGLIGAALVTAAGWLGGHMAYALGVGVDTNAFHGGPEDWTTVAREQTGNGPVTAGSAAGVSLVVVRTDDDREQPRVLANRCSHRGGPLAEGQLDRGCLQCPWHGSQFDVGNGEVRRGPATMPQPVYEVRTHDGQLQVRRDEPRSLRTNPVRP